MGPHSCALPRDQLDGQFERSTQGRAECQDLGLALHDIGRGGGNAARFADPFLDWSERRDHLAGQLADEIYQHFTQAGWLRRGTGRVVEITPRGTQELLPRLGQGEA